MRVLVLGDLASPHALRWAEAMAGQGHEVERVGFGEPTPSEVDAVELGSRTVSNGRYLRALPRWRAIARRFRPDLVHAHFVSSYGLMAALESHRAPVVQFAWGSDILWSPRRPAAQQRLVRYALRRAAAVVVDAEEVGDAVAGLAPGTPQVRVTFGPERSWTTAPREATTRILSPRQLKPFYHVDAIVGAFTRVAEDRPAWVLDVLTGGDDASGLRAAVSATGLGERVTFLPRLTRAGLQAQMLSAEIVCSVPDSDATSVALLEGMASGAFPIVSDLPANRSWVTDGENGLVVPAGDVERLAAALRVAIDDEELRRRAARTNRALIAERGTWEQAVTAVDELSRQLCEAARPL